MNYYNNEKLLKKISIIPKKPGCYLWKDKNGVIIYVGKAKNLNNRVKQYLIKNNSLVKIEKLMEEVHDIDYILVENENESLLLESNLIKENKPKYNVLLRENVSFPYIIITKEDHPRILYTHFVNKKIKGTFFGPFAITNSNKYDLFNLLNKIYPFRKCNKLPSKKCIYYDINQCLGPCINKDINKDTYNTYIKSLTNFFNGKIKNIFDKLEDMEKKYSENLNFEDAKKYYELRKSLIIFSQKQEIIFSSNQDEDIVGFVSKENVLFIIFFKYVNGVLLNKYEIINTFFSSVEEEILTQVFSFYKDSNITSPKNVYISLDSELLSSLSNSLNINFVNPKSGNKKRAIEMAFNNAVEAMNKKYLATIASNFNIINGMNELEKILDLSNLYVIEIFDNSSFYATNKVSAMVVYQNGLKNKNKYRKYILKNEVKSDAGFMEEVIYRRYNNLILKKETLPNLIIVDGGKIQVNACLKSLQKLNLDKVIPIIGLSKDEKHKTNKIITWDFKEINLDKKSSLYFYLLEMQDEVHRFAISFHRKRNEKSLFSLSLLEIKGLGKKNLEKLMSKFNGINNLKKATIEEISQVVSKKIAIEIKNKLDNERF